MSGSVQRGVARVVKAVATSDGAGVKLMRSIGTRAVDMVDPLLMLDRFHSDDPDAYIAGFPDHPHRGFATVTVMIDGKMRHEDSMGNRGELGPGSIQFMSAGSGIIHSEMPMMESGLMSGFQLWINLPASHKMTQPRYQDIPPDAVPEVAADDGTVVRVFSGEYGGVTGPVEDEHTQLVYMDVQVPSGQTITLPAPASHNFVVYPFEGSAVVGETRVPNNALAVVAQGGDEITVEVPSGDKAARFMFIGGVPLNEPVAKHGPFVMNTDEEIMQAFIDFRRGTLVRDKAAGLDDES